MLTGVILGALFISVRGRVNNRNNSLCNTPQLNQHVSEIVSTKTEFCNFHEGRIYGRIVLLDWTSFSQVYPIN